MAATKVIKKTRCEGFQLRRLKRGFIIETVEEVARSIVRAGPFLKNGRERCR